MAQSIDNISFILQFDKINSKKEASIARAQELILTLSEEIINAEDIEEIKNIRKKLNYYINKVKKELKKRGISEHELASFESNTDCLRKEISKYIRFLKRDDNIAKIDSYISNEENISHDEAKDLKRMILNEKRYNKRNNSIANKSDKSVQDIIEELPPIVSFKKENNFDNWVKSVFDDSKQPKSGKLDDLDGLHLDNDVFKELKKGDLDSLDDVFQFEVKNDNRDVAFSNWVKSIFGNDSKKEKPKNTVILDDTILDNLTTERTDNWDKDFLDYDFSGLRPAKIDMHDENDFDMVFNMRDNDDTNTWANSFLDDTRISESIHSKVKKRNYIR